MRLSTIHKTKARILLVLILAQGFGAVANASCDVALSALVKDVAGVRNFSDGAPVKSADQLRIQVSNPNNCYVALFWKDSEGQVINITPGQPEQLVAMTLIAFPSRSGWIRLTNASGVEEVVLIGDFRPVNALNIVGRAIAFRKVHELPAALSEFGYTVGWIRFFPTAD